MARVLHSTKWQPWIRSHHFVQEDHPSLEFINELLRFAGILSPRAGAQAESTIVGDGNRLVCILNSKNRRYGPEEFFAISWGIWRNVDQNSRSIKITRTIESM